MGKTDSLGPFERIALTAVLLCRDRAFGLAVFDKMNELSDRPVNLGAMYVTLDRLEEKGYVTSWMAEATEERGWRKKRFFRVLEAGEIALQESLTTSKRLDEAAESFWIFGKWRSRRAK